MLDIIHEHKNNDMIIHAVFEYCEGTLGSMMDKYRRKNQPIPVNMIKRVMRQLLQAVSILHMRMIMHRDIKPENILLDKKSKL